jgi:4-amino-4-deoxy-L-arabinose transferase-like glycosyltransferase
VTAFLYSIFGISELWARAGSAFASVFLVFITFKIAELLHNRQVAFAAMLPLLTGFEFLRRSRMGTTDIILVFFIYLGVYAYLRVRDNFNGKGWYLFWFSFALGFMVKFWAVAILPISVIATLFLRKDLLATLRSRTFWQGALVATLIVAPWHILMIAIHGQPFFEMYVIRNLLERSVSGLEGNTGGMLFYFMIMPRMFFPWFFLTPIAFLLYFYDHIRNHSENLILIVLTLVTLSIYSLAVQTKLFQYILPVFPAFAIMIGFTIVQAVQYKNVLATGGLLLVV